MIIQLLLANYPPFNPVALGAPAPRTNNTKTKRKSTIRISTVLKIEANFVENFENIILLLR
jgi:hypothetical protein